MWVELKMNERDKLIGNIFVAAVGIFIAVFGIALAYGIIANG